MLNELNNPAFMDAAINAGAMVALLLGTYVLGQLFFGAPVLAVAPSRRKR